MFIQRQPVKSLLLVISGMLLAVNHAHPGALERLFVPKAELWDYWLPHSAKPTHTLNHKNWNLFLKKYISIGADGINRLSYADVDTKDKIQLKNYITELEKIPVRQLSRQQQLVYWINLYNASTVNLVLRHYPVESIRNINISPGFFAMGPWDKKILTIEKQNVSLNDIEHRILRPIWKDPRLHYALNCASLGCPNLQPSAFTAMSMNDKLETAARDFINHPRGARVENGRLYVSSIYSWFQDDFGDNEQAVIQHIKKYADEQLKTAIADITTIAGDDYDWSLNDSNPPSLPSLDED